MANLFPFLRRGKAWWRRRKLIGELRARRVHAAHAFGILNIELTNKCPLKCVMCARTTSMTRSQGLMDEELFRKIVDEYVAANPVRAAAEDTWLHHFGESLVHPRVLEFVRYASARGVRTALSINPVMLKPGMARALLETGISKLYISLDGHDDESFEKIRGLPKSYDRSLENLETLLAAKRELGARTRIVLSMIDFGLNKESIARLKSRWESTPGIDEFLCKAFVTWDGSAEEVNRLAQDRVDNEALRSSCGAVSCRAPWQTMTIAWDGDVLPCCFDYDKKYILGNVAKQTLSEIWNGVPMQELRREFLANDVRNPLCRSCPVLYADIRGMSAVLNAG